MKLKKLHIQNYKSLVDLEIIEPNPFTVFAGPNGSGKSNIFEAIAFWNALGKRKDEKEFVEDVIELYGGLKSIQPKRNYRNANFQVIIADHRFTRIDTLNFTKLSKESNLTKNDDALENISFFLSTLSSQERMPPNNFDLFINQFSRIFINNFKVKRYNSYSSSKINEDASNLENVLHRLFEDQNRKEEIIEWMELFVPGLEDIKIEASSLSGSSELFFKEKGMDSFISKALISDGTYNILCLLAAVYQLDEPQFLCIEEPENGLNPYVVRSLVEFFRNQCEEKGHYIWLNTHPQTLVKELRPEELILVDKVEGATTIKQFSKEKKLYNLTLDEAWLSNALGGGIPW